MKRNLKKKHKHGHKHHKHKADKETLKKEEKPKEPEIVEHYWGQTSLTQQKKIDEPKDVPKSAVKVDKKSSDKKEAKHVDSKENKS